jgi:hypothetical protein
MAIKTLSIGLITAIAITGLFLTIISAGVLTTSTSLSSSGTISSVNVGVYSDSGCTQPLTSISWGSLAPGETTTRIIYLKNTGTVPVTLSMTTSSWTPSNSNTYLSLTWNRESYSLTAGNTAQATLTLTASPSAGNITSFSVNISFYYNNQKISNLHHITPTYFIQST